MVAPQKKKQNSIKFLCYKRCLAAANVIHMKFGYQDSYIPFLSYNNHRDELIALALHLAEHTGMKTADILEVS